MAGMNNFVKFIAADLTLIDRLSGDSPQGMPSNCCLHIQASTHSQQQMQTPSATS
jgi:hypothetical protein